MLIDIIVLMLIIAFSVLGAVQGFVVSVLYLVAWLAGVLSVWLFAGSLGAMLNSNIEGLNITLAWCLGAVLAFLLPFIIIRIAARIAKYFLKRSPPLSNINHLLGGVFGVIKGAAISLVILTVIHYLPTKGDLKQMKETSISYTIYVKIPFAHMWKEVKTDKEPKVEN
jgi:membrane protein required for colicin V production